MVRSLPSHPTLEALKKQAKALLATHQKRDAGVYPTLRLVPRLAGMDDGQIAAAKVVLQEAQHALARNYGFASWTSLKEYVAAGDRQNAADADAAGVRAEPVTPVALKKMGIQYGFRYDVTNCLRSDDSLQGAMVRTLVFNAPKDTDADIFAAEIDSILAGQLPDGRLDGHEIHSLQFTAGKLIQLAELGVRGDRPEVQKAVGAILDKKEANVADPFGIYDLRAFCRLGLTDEPKVRAAAIAAAEATLAHERQWQNPAEGCPWTPIEHLISLWDAREIAEVMPAIERTLRQIADGLNEVGCRSFKDPWGFVRLTSVIDHPMVREILVKELPMILRAQRPNGGWGGDTFAVIGALYRHGLLEALQKLPPLPPEWRVVRSIPAPCDDARSVVWDGERLWVRALESGTAIAISPENGHVEKRLDLGLRSAFCFSGKSLIHHADGKIRFVDRDTGQLRREIPIGPQNDEPTGIAFAGGKVWLADSFNWLADVIDPDGVEATYRVVVGCPTGGMGTCLAGTDRGVWHFDEGLPMLIHSSIDTEPVEWDTGSGSAWRTSHILDWAEKPFGNDTGGVTWDGEHLWVLDGPNNRICQVERAEASQRTYSWLDSAIQVAVEPIRASREGFESVKSRLRVHYNGRLPGKVTLTFGPQDVCRVEPEAIDVELPANSGRPFEFQLSPVTAGADKFPALEVRWQSVFKLADGPEHNGQGMLLHDLPPVVTVKRLAATITTLAQLRDSLAELPAQALSVGDHDLAELRLAVAGDALGVCVKVRDPRCKIDATEWEGCNAELYFSPPGSPKVRQFIFYAGPNPDSSRLEAYESGNRRPTPEFAWRIVGVEPFGYEIHALIPLGELLLRAGAGEFLTDLAVGAPLREGEPAKFNLLYTRLPSRCAFLHNNYYALAIVEP